MGFEKRTPLWLFMANRPRAGKYYLNGVAQTLYYGHSFEDAPIAADDARETAKRITTVICAARRSMHFANQQDFLKDASFIGAITREKHMDRQLGSNDASAQIELPNELEFCMSGNIGLGWREDVPDRARIITLSYYDEDANSRVFTYPDLHGYVAENRELILSAVYTLLINWREKDCPPGGTFTSFPAWARVVGGVCVAAGLGDPCAPYKNTALGGDAREQAMRELYELAYAKYPNQWIHYRTLWEFVAGQQPEIAYWQGLIEPQHKVNFGKDVRKYHGRWLEGIMMYLKDPDIKNITRTQVRFTCNPGGEEKPKIVRSI
ncbi:MAG: hypothetical protein JO170_06065 [Verrucomicrobia bacterium]|nr:hypothetical protein [Verrucomicrobiota bacterium]